MPQLSYSKSSVVAVVDLIVIVIVPPSSYLFLFLFLNLYPLVFTSGLDATGYRTTHQHHSINPPSIIHSYHV